LPASQPASQPFLDADAVRASLDNNKGVSRHLTPEQQKKYNPWSKKQRNFYHRALSGMAAGGGSGLRLLTLTSSLRSEPALLTKHASVLIKRIRRGAWEKRRRGEHRHVDFEYIGTHETSEGGLHHLHVLYKGCFIPQRWLSAAWAELHAAPIVHVCAIRQRREAQRTITAYISKYLNKDMAARFSYSSKWCFKGFVGYWNLFKREFGADALARWRELLAGVPVYFKALCGAPDGMRLHDGTLVIHVRQTLLFEQAAPPAERAAGSLCPDVF
jgi:hypothetical protein